MFEKIMKLFREGGVKVGMIKQYDSILDHEKISMTQDEYDRIQQNKSMYVNKQRNVEYETSNGLKATRRFHSLNLPKIVSRKLAKLVFNEGCSISIDNTEANEFLNEILKDSKFFKNFGEELEAGYAIGGLALRPYLDSSTNKIKIAYCRADTFFPLQSNTNDISEAVIANTDVVTEGKETIYYTLLEFHEWINGVYVISNELYRSDKADKLGEQVALARLDKYKDLAPIVQMQGFKRPLFVYIKLAGKNNNNLSSPLGAGVIDNSKQQLLDINEKYDQFMWEIEKAAAKITASDHFFKVRFDENGNPVKQFNTKTDIYQRIKSDDPFYDVYTPDLRANEFINSINFILRIIELSVGFSSGTFSFDGEGVKTATEVIAENSETFSTRADNVLIVEEALKELITSIFELAVASGLYKGKLDFNINVDFDDGVFESKDAQLEFNNKAVAGQIMSRKKAMMKTFGLSEKEALKELKQIQNELLGVDLLEHEQQSFNDEFGDGE